MISILQGKIADRASDTLVIMTSGGIGFEVAVPSSLAATAGANNSEVRIYTYLHVTQDGVQLFGFASQEQ